MPMQSLTDILTWCDCHHLQKITRAETSRSSLQHVMVLDKQTDAKELGH